MGIDGIGKPPGASIGGVGGTSGTDAPRGSESFSVERGAAKAELGNAGKQKAGRHANNRSENSHMPFRRRERVML